MIVDITPVFPKPNLRKSKISKQLHAGDTIGAMLPMEQNTSLLALHSRLYIIWLQIPFSFLSVSPCLSSLQEHCSLSLEWATHFREPEPQPIKFPPPGLAWNALLLFFACQDHSPCSRPNQIPLQPEIIHPFHTCRFYTCLHFMLILFGLTFLLAVCFSPLTDHYSSACTSDASQMSSYNRHLISVCCI